MVPRQLRSFPFAIDVGAEHGARIARVSTNQIVARHPAVDTGCTAEDCIDLGLVVELLLSDLKGIRNHSVTKFSIFTQPAVGALRKLANLS